MNGLLVAALPALMLGLASTMHCGAMCGGIAVMFAKHRGVKLLLLHLGRLLGYVSVGLVGCFLINLTLWQWSSPSPKAIFLLNGAVLCIIGFQLLPLRLFSGRVISAAGTGVWRFIRGLQEPATRALPDSAAPVVHGFTWGLLPCSMVYSAMLLALAQPDYGAAASVMALFGIGTLPALVSLAVLSQQLRDLMKGVAVRYWAGGVLLVWGGLIVAFALLSGGDAGMHHHHH